MSKPGGHWRGIAGGSIALAATRVAGMAFGLALMIVLARTLPPAQLGVVTVCFSTALIGGLLCTLNVGAGAVRFVNAYLENSQTGRIHGYVRFGRRTVLGIATLSWGVLAIAGFAASRGLIPSPTVSIVVGLVAAPLFGWLRVATANVAATGAVLRASLPATLMRPVLMLLSVALIWWLAGGLSVATVLAAYLLSLGMVVALQSRLFEPILAPYLFAEPSEPNEAVKTWRRVGLDLLIPTLFLELFVDIVVLFAALVLDTAQIAALGIVLRVQAMVLFLVTSINMVVSPRIAAAHSAGQRDVVDRLLFVSTHLKLWPSLLAVLFLAAFGDVVLSIFAEAYAPFRWPLVVMALAPVIMAIAGPVVLFVTILGHERQARNVFATALGLLLVLVAGLGFALGLMGVAVAVVLVWTYWHVRLYWLILNSSDYSTMRFLPA